MSTQGSATIDGAAARTAPRDQDRLRLRQLDACLDQLECANERGEVTVPDTVALLVRRHVPAIAPGMPITSAIQLVMREQEPHLASSLAATATPPLHDLAALTGHLNDQNASPGGDADPPGRGERPSNQPLGRSSPADGATGDIDTTRARELTERIKAAAMTVGQLGSLLVEAHEGRAWYALGYSTWGDYVRTEFHLSRSRSYELLDHGRVVRAVEAVVGVSGIPDISPYAAAQIKPHLEEVIDAIRRARFAGLASGDIAQVAEEVVRKVRARINEDRRGLKPNVDLTSLYDAVRTLAHMPSVTQTILLVSKDQYRNLDDLADAHRWLAEFARAWTAYTTHVSGGLRGEPTAC